MLNGAAPTFDLSTGGLLLPAVRSLSVIALFQILGALVFLTTVAPRAFGKAPVEVGLAAEQRILRLIWCSLLFAAAALLGWLSFEAKIMAEADTLAKFPAALAEVLTQTSFGNLIMLQLTALVATGIALHRRRCRMATVFAAAAIVLQTGHSHAFSMAGGADLLLASDVIHFLGGAVWLGGLAPLLLVIRAAPASVGAAACRWYSPIGKLAVAAVAASAGYQGYVMAGGFIGLIGTAYGWVELMKLALLAALTSFAVLNRYRFAPALTGTDPAKARRSIVCSIVLQTGAGVLVMLAASLLSSLPPGMHLEPIWPFSYRPSLIALREDSDLTREIIGAALALAAAVVAFGVAGISRRLRWLGLVVGSALVILAFPHFSPLMIESYPTSFYHSPTGFAAISIAEGAALYPANCARCHGADGTGHGPDARKLAIPPADLTAPHLWAHDDCELFWWLSHGIDAPEGGFAMPGFADTLDEDQRWALIDYIRAYNAGAARAAAGAWMLPVAAPGFRALCPDGSRVTLDVLRGKVTVLQFKTGAADLRVAGGPSCLVSDPAVAEAYEVVSGFHDGIPPGTTFVVDENGWLRDVGDYTGPELSGRIREADDHPLPPTKAMPGHHHMGG